MSLRKKYKKTDHEEMDMGPLNDILFILMFFFLIISTMANPNVIKLTNPKSKNNDTKTKQSLVVSIKKDGSTYIGQQQVLFDSLESYLGRIIDKKDSTIKQGVVINADTSVPINKVVGIMTAARRAGAASASLSVDPN
jgi:biopolymer transport protein ExbD